MGRKKLYEGLLCSCGCGRQAAIKGMCASCYSRKYNREYYRNSENFKGFAWEPKTERNDEIVKLAKRGIRKSEIARKFGISRQRVCEILKKIEIKNGGKNND